MSFSYIFLAQLGEALKNTIPNLNKDEVNVKFEQNQNFQISEKMYSLMIWLTSCFRFEECTIC